MVSDSAVKQMICNVLDNAVEASPARVELEATREDGHLILRVLDAGPGFDPDVLAQIGKPYNSTKGKPGSVYFITDGAPVEIKTKRGGYSEGPAIITGRKFEAGILIEQRTHHLRAVLLPVRLRADHADAAGRSRLACDRAAGAP